MPIRPLPPVLAEKARVELNEDPQKIEENIRLIKEWLKEQPHLLARTDDQWILAFLRGCKYRHDQVKTKIELYYTMRSLAPDLYSVKYYDPKVMDIIDTGTILILPTVENLGDPQLFLLNVGKHDPKKISIFDIMRVAGFMFQICFMEDDNFTISGMITVVDLSGARLCHYTQASIKQIRNIVRANQDAVPLRIKGTHFLNVSSVFVTVLNVVKRLFNEKMKKRLSLHSNLETFHKHVSKNILPIEYGGVASNLKEHIDYWKRKIHEYRPFLDEDQKFGIDESKRLPKVKATVREPPRLEID